jgi:hypothetical protein
MARRFGFGTLLALIAVLASSGQPALSDRGPARPALAAHTKSVEPGHLSLEDLPLATPAPSPTPAPTPTSVPTDLRTPAAAAVMPGPASASQPGPLPPAAIAVAGLYSDCSGATPLASRWQVYRDTCTPTTYLLAHNYPGIGSGFFGYGAGTRLAYGGAVYTVREVLYLSPARAWSLAFSSPAPLTLQTCANQDGSVVLVVRAF